MIIGAVYNDYFFADISDALKTSASVTFNKGQEGPGTLTSHYNLGADRFWSKLPSSGSNKYYRYNTDGYQPRNVFSIPQDTGNEFWYRLCQIMPGTPSSANGNSNPLCLFWNWNGARYKKVAGVFYDNSTNSLRYKTYTTTEGSDAITSDNLIAAYANYPARNAAEGNMMFDFRIVLDKVAGFIQLYDYTGARKAEILGKTTEGLAATHVSITVQQVCNTNSVDAGLFAIVANEPTFGMYMMPLCAKSAGSYNDQDSGSHNSFIAPLTNPIAAGPSLAKSTDEIVGKRFSYKPQNSADVSLPANYSLLSLHWKSTIETTSPGLAVPKHGSFVRSSSRGLNIDTLEPSVQPNVDTLGSGVYNVRSLNLNKNPFTDQPFTLADLDDLEFGIYI